jgi:prephenate dehydratase
MLVGVLGPEGTHSEMAALALGFPEDALCYFATIEDVARDLIERRVDCGVIPFENSIEGSIGTALDVLLNLPLQIAREIILPIRHFLAAVEGADVQVVYSHWQAIAQCNAFLNAFGREVVAVSSTSQAAQMASEERRAAAITSSRAAQRYHLRIIEADIQDVKENFTRFVVVTRRGGQPQAQQDVKTSIVLELKQNRPGALYEVLHVFADRQLNLTKIESRPAKRSLGEYVFYIDLEGSASDAAVLGAFDALQKHVSRLKVLGSYTSETHFMP